MTNKRPRKRQTTRDAIRERRRVSEKRRRTEHHLRMTIEDWRLKKRQEWRAVMHALDLFAYGCAYAPAANDFYELQRAAGRIADAMAEEWVCW